MRIGNNISERGIRERKKRWRLRHFSGVHRVIRTYTHLLLLQYRQKFMCANRFSENLPVQQLQEEFQRAEVQRRQEV